ncbi:uncharacterized protein LOC133706651 [Rosa rugosa]|uniref:uncharacterized protein LOC133706651 n=1 Tax=Rosa rugosa TaxID=74645 RepID=UPI002B412177|nr:uncharacterized protein LOC133706651 [Rosa rugosa]
MEMGANQQEVQSMFVMVRFNRGPYHGAVYKVKLEHGESGEASAGAEVESSLPVLNPVSTFFDKSFELPKNCLFEGARFGSKLYLMANGHGSPCKPVTTVNSFVCDMNSSSDLQQFSPPKAAKPFGAVISAYGMLYYFAHPSSSPHIPDPSFERYNPTTNLWESLPSYPYKTLPKPCMEVVGYAVCYGYILFSMYNRKECAVLAFHIGTEKWHQVKITNPSEASSYYPFLGRAVVVDNIIYAPSFFPDEVIAFSFWRDSDHNCFLGTPLPLMVMDTPHPPSPLMGRITKNLVHLGMLHFCLVQTGRNQCSVEHQYLCITTFRILREEGGMDVRTLRSSVFQVGMMGSGAFHVNFSFTPDCEDIEPEEQYCPTAPAGSKSESALTSEEKGNKDHCRWDVATGKQEDFFSIPTKPLIPS